MSEILPTAYRAARLHVASQIPELAPQLADDFDVVKNALIAHIQENGHEIEMRGSEYVHARDQAGIPKLEQHAYVSYLAFKQMEMSVEGRGPAARFADEVLPNTDRVPGMFESGMASVLATSCELVKTHYSDPEDTDRQWWRNAYRRYDQLGLSRRETLARPSLYLTRESGHLDSALTSPTLGREVAQLSDYVFDQARLVSETGRIETAHQLVYLATAKAGLGTPAFQRSRPLSELDAPLVFSEKHQQYHAQLPGSNWNAAGLREIGNKYAEIPTMKCPVHTAPEHNQAEDTLTTNVHAAINLAATYGLFANASFATLGSEPTTFILPDEFSF